MADELKQYRFIAAIFREPRDLTATIEELRSNSFSGRQLLVVANHRSEDARKAVDGCEADHVTVVTVHPDGGVNAGDGDELPAELHSFLDALTDNGDANRGSAAKGASPDHGSQQAQVYTHLRQDVAGGAMVLIASVADSEEQLQGARLMLQGNCECVLTHELAVEGS